MGGAWSSLRDGIHQVGVKTGSEWFASPLFPTIAAFHSAYFVAAWLLIKPLQNGGLVDWAWPSGFSAIALTNGLTGTAPPLRRALITAMYLLCGLRFNYGWILRTRHHGEDKRWDLWRQRWSRGEGWLGLRSHALNFFFFYQAQSLSNLLMMLLPSYLACNNDNGSTGDSSRGSGGLFGGRLHWMEVLGAALWAFSFYMENVADVQLAKWKASRNPNKGRVCNVGLWKYSRHPNYFFEFMIWVAYAIFAWPSARTTTDKSILCGIPLLAYYFLVHFTGVPLTEQGSLTHRGAEYARYQQQTSMFFPWFPRQA
ncbi:Steroid 5-alpha reductase family enzyme [Balamuthia mandrillaris]